MQPDERYRAYRCELPRSDVQNLDARVAGYAHKRVTIFSLGPNDAVVIELLVARSRVISQAEP